MATLSVFGCAFDPEVGVERLATKQAYARLAAAGLPPGAPADPAAVLRPYALALDGVVDGGSVFVEPWARPLAPADDADAFSPDAVLTQLRDGAGRRQADAVRAHVESLDRHVPLMVGVDHSASIGAIEAASARHGPDNLLLVVLDAHLDVVPGHIRQELLAFANERSGAFDIFGAGGDLACPPDDACGSFLHDLICRGVVLPENLLVIGCADLPRPELRGVDDIRIARYLAHLDGLFARGMRVVSREQVLAAASIGALVRTTLGQRQARAAYLSVDMDVGAHAAVTGVRFLDQVGLRATAITAVFHACLQELTAAPGRLAGLDLMEIDFYRAGAVSEQGRDPTYDIAIAFIEMAARRLASAGSSLCDRLSVSA